MTIPLTEIVHIVLPVFLIVALGFVFGKLRTLDLRPLSDFVIYISTPCLMISSLARNPIELVLAGKVFVCVLAVTGGSLLLGYVVIRLMGLDQRVYLPPVAFANTGNMGLPLVMFAFGERGFAVGIIYMVATTIVHYTVGVAILSYKESRFEVLKLPLIYACGLGLWLSLSGEQMPVPVGRAVDLLGQASIPTMIFSLGYKLSEISLDEAHRSFLFGGLRVVGGVCLGYVAVLFTGLGGVSANVVVLDSAMPPAVFNFVLAEKYGRNSKVVASIIMAGTLISLLSTPIILALLFRR